MSYRAEKIKQTRKIKRMRRILLFALVLVICSLCVLTSFYPAASWKYYFSLPSVVKRTAGELRMHFLEVGQGECTLVEFPDGKTMLVDGGSSYANSVDYVMRYLNALGINSLDYVVLTGCASNRAGALSEIAAYKEIGYVYFPRTGEKVSEEYSAFSAFVGRKSIPATTAKRYLEIQGEDETYRAVFLSPYSLEASSSTGATVLWIEWKGYGALICGDMTAEEEGQLLLDETLGYFSPLSIDLAEQTYLVRMANFGKATSYTQDFLGYLRPQAAVISCLESGSFTPDTWAIPEPTRAYRTDLLGTVVASITQSGLSVQTAK